MGRVLLAGLEPDDLEQRLSRMHIDPLTPTTVPDASALRAELDRVRGQSWAAVDQELEQGVRSAAVPIHDASGRVSAAMNVSVHASRMTMQALRKEVLPHLLRTAASIEAELGAVASPSARRSSTRPGSKAASGKREFGPPLSQSPVQAAALVRQPSAYCVRATSEYGHGLTTARISTCAWRSTTGRSVPRPPHPRRG